MDKYDVKRNLFMALAEEVLDGRPGRHAAAAKADMRKMAADERPEGAGDGQKPAPSGYRPAF